MVTSEYHLNSESRPIFARFGTLCLMPTPGFYMVLDPLKIVPEKQYVLGLQTQIV